MRWWLVAALVAAVAAPVTPAAPARAAPASSALASRPERHDRPRRPVNYTLSVANELGMVDQLRRQLLADNEDYLPSESEGIPMRARLSGESDERGNGGGERGGERGERGGERKTTHQETTRQEKRFKEIAAREARLEMYLTPPVFRAAPKPLEPTRDKEDPDRDPHESRLSNEEIQEHGHEQPEDDKIDNEPTPAPDDNAGPHHEEMNDHTDEGFTDRLPKAIPTRNFVSVEKFDEEYEFKPNRQFPHKPVGGFDEPRKPGAGELKGDEALVMEMENRVEEEAHAQVMYDADPPPAEFLPRAHDDPDTTPGSQMEHATTAAIRPVEPSKSLGPTDKPDITISKRDLLYYMDEEKFAKSNLSIGFNADVAIDYKDFAQRERTETKTKLEPAGGDTTPASKKYRVLKMRGGGRRSGGGGRRFIQEEGAGGVAILNVDAGPFPEFRLPRDRRQYMHAGDQSDSDAAASSAQNHSLEPQMSLHHDPS